MPFHLVYCKIYIFIGVSSKNLLMSNYKLYKDLDYLKNIRLIGYCIITMGRYKICDIVSGGQHPLLLWRNEFMLCTFFCKCNNSDQNSKGEVQQVLGLTSYYNAIL